MGGAEELGVDLPLLLLCCLPGVGTGDKPFIEEGVVLLGVSGRPGEVRGVPEAELDGDLVACRGSGGTGGIKLRAAFVGSPGLRDIIEGGLPFCLPFGSAGFANISWVLFEEVDLDNHPVKDFLLLAFPPTARDPLLARLTLSDDFRFVRAGE